MKFDNLAPLYKQVVEEILRRIDTGEWPPRHKLPSEPELADELGVARGTLRRALAELHDTHRLVKVHGKGTFVAATALQSPMTTTLTSIAEELERRGISYETAIVHTGVEKAARRIAQRLQLDSRDEVIRIDRLRKDDEGAIAFTKNWVRLDSIPTRKFLEADLSQTSLFAFIETELGERIAFGERSITATVADAELAGIVGIGVGEPLLFMEQTSFLDESRPIECSDIWINPNRMRVHAVAPR
ncbi:GntR family transcriptional regulator [Corynebacterium sp. H130]|uniref:GntR family transcriptional regulator n=1 Tax=Corynebacterium sp. H130 TaxID=3133444 RepID=UPI0030A69D7C